MRRGAGYGFDFNAVQWIRHAYKSRSPFHTAQARSLWPRQPSGRAAAPASSTMDPHRAAECPPRLRQPILHSLERPGRGRLAQQNPAARAPAQCAVAGGVAQTAAAALLLFP